MLSRKERRSLGDRVMWKRAWSSAWEIEGRGDGCCGGWRMAGDGEKTMVEVVMD